MIQTSGLTKQPFKVLTHTKFSQEERRRNIEYAISSNIPDISVLKNGSCDSTGIVIAGGPSVDNYPEEIKFKQFKGGKVFVIERMIGWCNQNNIVPDYVVVLDASENVNEGLQVDLPECKYLLATQCRPDTFEWLKSGGCECYLYHTPQLELDMSVKGTTVNGGGSVALISIALAMTLGCNDLYIYGFDCHISDGDYAKGITGKGDDKEIIRIESNGKDFETQPQYVSFAQQFFILMKHAQQTGLIKSIWIRGDSLVNQMANSEVVQ